MNNITITVLTVMLAGQASSQSLLAPTPPMGWNSWDSFGTTVTEDEVKANADYMAAKLARYGWEYIVIDIQWSEVNPKTHGYRPDGELAMDSNGRLTVHLPMEHGHVRSRCQPRGRAGLLRFHRQTVRFVPRRPFPDHGVQAPDTDYVGGAFYDYDPKFLRADLCGRVPVLELQQARHHPRGGAKS